MYKVFLPAYTARSWAIFFLVCTMFLAACSQNANNSENDSAENDPNGPTQEEVAVNATTIQYQCAGGKILTATYDHSDPEQMRTIITVEGDSQLQNLELHSVVAASGAKSSNGKIVWWTKEDHGQLWNEEPPAGDGKLLLGDCKELPAME